MGRNSIFIHWLVERLTVVRRVAAYCYLKLVAAFKWLWAIPPVRSAFMTVVLRFVMLGLATLGLGFGGEPLVAIIEAAIDWFLM